jgi:hypothetical protein
MEEPMRTRLGILTVIGALALPLTVIAPSASADGQCRAGYSPYDTGIPGGFKQDRNLNGIVCDRWKQTSDGYRHWYTDDH